MGLWTLFAKEVRRFMRVPEQTLLSPVVTTVLYFVVFGWSLGGRLRDVEGVPYARFIVPGLVALGVVTNAYSNTASSLFVMKLQGTVVDLLVSPLTYGEILWAFVGAAVVRGLLVGGITWAVAGLFGGFGLAHPLAALGLVLLAAVLFAALGLLTAIWASSFEQVNFIPDLLHHSPHVAGGRLLLGRDAPAGRNLMDETLRLVRAEALMSQDGVLVVQHSSREEIPARREGYQIEDSRRYGETALSFLRLQRPGEPGQKRSGEHTDGPDG